MPLLLRRFRKCAIRLVHLGIGWVWGSSRKGKWRVYDELVTFFKGLSGLTAACFPSLAFIFVVLQRCRDGIVVSDRVVLRAQLWAGKDIAYLAGAVSLGVSCVLVLDEVWVGLYCVVGIHFYDVALLLLKYL